MIVEPTLRDTFGNILVDLGKQNNNIIVLDADLSASTRTNKFAKNFPKRFFNLGIAEQNMMGVALGFAISGKIPVVSGFSIFTTGRAWEFIRFASHDNLNIKIVTTHGGFVGEDGTTHNALEDLSLMASLPNMSILIPSDNIELKQILEYSFNQKGPFYVRLPRGSFPQIHMKEYKFSLGNPDIIKEGTDICLIGTGYGSVLAKNCASLLEKKMKISLKIINLPTIKPINTESLLREIKKTKGIIVIEEHNIYCGFGSILARLISDNYPMPMKFIGADDSFGQSGKREIVLDNCGLNQEVLAKKIKELISIK